MAHNIKVSIYSNFLNSHQLPLALAFSNMAGVDFAFISLLETQGVVGRKSLDYDYPFVIREYESAEQKEYAMRHAVEDDIVIFGDMAGQEQYVKCRAKSGRTFFRYTERLLKRGDWWRFFLPKIYRTWARFTKYKNDSYILCASAYASRDLAMFGYPRDRCLKWGYFPDVAPFEGRFVRKVQGKVSMCSAQRLIGWKRVDLQVRLAALLRRDGYNFNIRIGGYGPERRHLEKLAERLGVDDCVEFLGELDSNAVRSLMRSSDIFLATSNKKEGWGATVNEAMAAGCCVVASDQVGSVPYLIEDGVSGLTYAGVSLDNLYVATKRVLDDTNLIQNIAFNAINTIKTLWSAEEAAKRLVEFYANSNSAQGYDFKSGPLSPA